MKPRKFKRLPVLLRLTLCPLACCVLALVLIIQGLAMGRSRSRILSPKLSSHETIPLPTVAVRALRAWRRQALRLRLCARHPLFLPT